MAEAATVNVLFDATRLVARLGRAAPTGIDRVDLAYAEALGSMPGIHRHLLVFDALGPRLMSAASAADLLRGAARAWSDAGASPSIAFQTLRDWVAAPPGLDRAPRIRMPAQAAVAGARTPRHRSAREWFADRRRLEAILSERTRTTMRPVYLNSSHGRLYRSRVGRWLSSAGIGSVFFVHDLIPIEFPEFNRSSEPARHAMRLATISRHADRVLVNSSATHNALTRHWGSPGAREVPIEVLPLGVGTAFDPSRARPAIATSHPYFVMVGTLEPRKNHALVLGVWQALVARHGAAAPRLVIIGRRGWENRAVFERLDRETELATHVAECEGLTDPEVASLVEGARALLMPSFAEGFGLPVAEALTLGTRVLASDLPAHREVGAGAAVYLDPHDDEAWRSAIEALVQAPLPAIDVDRRANGYRPPRWPAHFDALHRVLRAVAMASPGHR